MPKKNWKGESRGQNFTEQSPATRGETLRVRFQGRLEEGRRRGDRRVEDPCGDLEGAGPQRGKLGHKPAVGNGDRARLQERFSGQRTERKQ